MSDAWTIRSEPEVLLPGRPATFEIRYRPARDHRARSVRAQLRGVERYRYDKTETSLGASGRMTTSRVTRTEEEELAVVAATVAPESDFFKGQERAWTVELPVPELGPASFEGDALRVDWWLDVNADVPMGFDPGISQVVHIAQPTALLRAGVVPTGAFGLYEEAPANVDAYPAQIRLEPVPLSLADPYTGSFTVETAEPIEVQEVRLELRVKAEVTRDGGHREEISIGRGRLEEAPRLFGGPFARHAFSGDASGAWLPSLNSPHGQARGEFHVILALAWAPDIHYVRDVALATTTDL